MTQEERDGDSIPQGVDTKNLRYAGYDLAEVQKEGLASEIIDELVNRAEGNVMLSPCVGDRLCSPVPLFVKSGEFAFFWAYELMKANEYECFRLELPSDDFSPSWTIGTLLRAAIVGEFSLLTRHARNVFEIENDELLVVEFLAGHLWKVYLASEMPDLKFDEGDTFFVVVNMMSA